MSNDVQSDLYQDGQALAWEHAAPGISRQIYGYDDRVMMVKVKFEQDAVGTRHQHPHTQVTYVESGVFAFSIGDETKVIRAGDGCFIPANTDHDCVCLEAGVLLDVFSPHREDFLPTPL
ncbi:cupin domain-containing protein [Chitinophaga pendula]|uniref:cupin domain-containing protein n=1 Tax=Chitinophaga TaxID=79328 RepID=UPI000BAF6978|nr:MULTISPECIES: cupin domain-containing protein [Chitinophaga]ASZ12210.1 cupin [Chitinophaga sp. MD30]UCJ04760.1 cupin domain-containing protein [Chitinophaga pendula]